MSRNTHQESIDGMTDYSGDNSGHAAESRPIDEQDTNNMPNDPEKYNGPRTRGALFY